MILTASSPKLLVDRHEEIDPLVIMVEYQTRTDTGVLTHYEGRKYEGRLLRVFPRNLADIQFLQSLDHHVWKWAPAHGEGVMVHPSRLENLAPSDEV